MPRIWRAHLLVLGMTAGWGTTFVLVKDALSGISPLLFNLLRMCLAFLCVTILYRRQWKRLTRRAWQGGALIGLCMGCGYQLQTAGLNLTTPSKSAFLTGTMVVLVPLFAAMPGLRTPGARRPRWNAWMGALLALAGIALLAAPAAGPGDGLFPRGLRAMNLGDLLSLGCAAMFALQIVTQDHYSRDRGRRGTAEARPRVPFEQLVLLQIGFSAAFIAVTSPFFEKPHLQISATVVLAVLVTGTLATAAAFAIQSWAQQYLPPTHMALLFALEPVFAWLTSLALLGERLGRRASAGALLILAGIGVTELIRGGIQPTGQEDAPLN